MFAKQAVYWRSIYIEGARLYCQCGRRLVVRAVKRLEWHDHRDGKLIIEYHATIMCPLRADFLAWWRHRLFGKHYSSKDTYEPTYRVQRCEENDALALLDISNGQYR